VLKNVAAGIDDTDAVNVQQLRDAVTGLDGGSLSVKYVADVSGRATNTIALTGDGSGSAVTITNVAAGVKDTDAANVGQIKNAVTYDVDASGARTNRIALAGGNGGPVTLSNVAAGKSDGDAANVKQVSAAAQAGRDYTDQQIGDLRDDTGQRLTALSSDLRKVQREARHGIASVAAASQLRFDDRPGVFSTAAAIGGFKDSLSFAVGAGYTTLEQAWRFGGSVAVAFGTGDMVYGAALTHSW
jgi:trimeric autotransporter adhesin